MILRRAATALTSAGCALLVTLALTPPAVDGGHMPPEPPRLPTTATSPPVSPPVSPSSSPAAPTFSRSRLTQALDRYLRDRPGALSISVRDLSTGLSYTYNRELRTATASIVKVNIVIALLLQAQRGHRGLTAAERDLAARAIKVSDNDAASALWYRIGGAPGLAAANRKLGLRATTPGPGGAWGATTTTAADQVRLLNTLASRKSPLTPKNRRYVLSLMSRVAPEQSWGITAAADPKARTAVKNGWLPRPSQNNLWTLTSIGRVRNDRHDLLIAVISERHPSYGTGVKTIEHVTRTVTQSLTQPLPRPDRLS
ncbi:beta-lactamase class A [Thermocatellispora tengchongensis]|uniref:Beta-lactamase class A n=1 Tax=Thermocatellispora tengchongensis TaxID=1073253 RepID=A0A840PHY6_9ACTN|nr:serine hydrolase [Thermocatellispora tengchongensis]MBB5138589.1 beta-lactamase class A [Thermocatellispora tengchongensis]